MRGIYKQKEKIIDLRGARTGKLVDRTLDYSDYSKKSLNKDYKTLGDSFAEQFLNDIGKGLKAIANVKMSPMRAALFFLLFSTTIAFSGIGVSSFIGYTSGYYEDIETSTGNMFIARGIDFLLNTSSFTSTTTAISLSPNDLVHKGVTILPEDSNPFKYVASTTNVTGDEDFCNALNVDADVEGFDIYDGSLVNMLTGTTTTLDSWSFSIGMGTNNFQNSICNFDTEYFGSQTRHDLELGGGFNDVESIENTISTWGFRLNKVYYDVDREIVVDPEINQCEARSQGYWGNHEGCSLGTGDSDWEAEINDLSGGFSGVFGSSSGAQICEALHIPSCPSGSTTEGKLCRAENKLLADELNVVSGKLDINAIIAGADDGSVAFDNLGLTSLSRISVALTAIEIVLANGSSTNSEITDAGHVAERIYTFYEDENPQAPMCLYDEEHSVSVTLSEVEGENEWVEIYNQTNVAIDINGWEICDNNECDVLSASSPIPAQGYGLITVSSTTASNELPAFWYLPLGVVEISIPDSRIGNGLSNNEDMLILKRPDGVIIDQMNYGDPDTGWANYNDDVWNPGAIDVAEGNVLARVPSGFDTNQPSDWTELTPPTVDLIFPDESGSYNWFWGQLQTILWSAVNNNGDDNDLGINLFYVRDITQDGTINDGDEMLTIVEDTENDGEFEWTVTSGFKGFIWIYLVATGMENPMLNSGTISGEIWDPIQLFIGPIEETASTGFSALDTELDTEAPVITISGNNPALVEQGSDYNDLGATVTDNINPNIGIDIENLVDANIIGEYEVIYTATDQAGNVAEAIRIVIVYDPEIGPPVIEESVIEEESFDTAQDDTAVSEEPVVEEPIVSEAIVEEESFDTAQDDTAVSEEPITEEESFDTAQDDTAVSEEPIIESATSTEPMIEEIPQTSTSTEPIIEEESFDTAQDDTAVSEEPITEAQDDPLAEDRDDSEESPAVSEEPVEEELTTEPEPTPEPVEEPTIIEDPVTEPLAEARDDSEESPAESPTADEPSVQNPE